MVESKSKAFRVLEYLLLIAKENSVTWVFNRNGTDLLLLLMFGVSGALTAKGATGTWLDGSKKLDWLSLTVDVLNKTV